MKTNITALSVIGLLATSVYSAEISSYREYVQGSIGINLTQPFNGDSYVNVNKSYDPDTITTINVDLLLLPNYYGGLYLSYSDTISNASNANYLVLEKRYNDFSFVYKNVSSQEEFEALFDNDLNLYNKNGDLIGYAVANETTKTPIESSRYEFRYYFHVDSSFDKNGKKEKFTYVSLFYEDTDRLLIGRDSDGKLTKDYYVDGNVKIMALAVGIKRRDFEIHEGFFVNGAFEMGLATMSYTNDFDYGDNGIGESPVLAWGMNFEAGYKFVKSEYINIVCALYGGYTTAGDSLSLGAKEMYSQGDVGARVSFSF